MHILIINISILIIKQNSIFSKNNLNFFKLIFQKYFNVIYNYYLKNKRI